MPEVVIVCVGRSMRSMRSMRGDFISRSRGPLQKVSVPCQIQCVYVCCIQLVFTYIYLFVLPSV
jgi:hypothetical protein